MFIEVSRETAQQQLAELLLHALCLPAAKPTLQPMAAAMLPETFPVTRIDGRKHFVVPVLFSLFSAHVSQSRSV